MRIGLVVNPLAGLGGAVGLKGSDGMAAEALRRGATPQAGPRVVRALQVLARRHPGAALVVAPGALGAEWVAELDLRAEVLALGAPTGTAEDTRAAARAMAGCDLLVFAGGDGTARDVAGVWQGGLLGIPCGVKMHSGVFALSPEAAGVALADLLSGPGVIWDEGAEIMDIDEDLLRAGRLAPRLYGLARVPRLGARLQAAKGGPRQDASAALGAVAAEIAAALDPGALYLVGPGTSAKAVLRAAGHAGTLLGTDALLGGALVAGDASAAQLEALAQGRPLRIVLGVTGRQGFLLGRGNQVISAPLIAQAGREGLIVLASAEKLAALSQPRLWIDTGDPDLDTRLTGFVAVHTGPRQRRLMRVSVAE